MSINHKEINSPHKVGKKTTKVIKKVIIKKENETDYEDKEVDDYERLYLKYGIV
jgi:hypothetical protein